MFKTLIFIYNYKDNFALIASFESSTYVLKFELVRKWNPKAPSKKQAKRDTIVDNTQLEIVAIKL